MTAAGVIGVDPGCGVSRTAGTGIVAVIDRTPTLWATVRRRSSRDPRDGYERTVTPRNKTVLWCEPVEDYIDRVCDLLYKIAEHPLPDDGSWLVAVEAVKAPTGYKNSRRTPVNPAGDIDAAGLFYVVMREFRARKVWPAKHGSRHLTRNGGTGEVRDYYPDALVGAGADTLGDGGPNDHLWAAWDVACTAVDGRP